MFFLNQPTVHHRLAKQNSRRKRSGQKKYSSLDNAPTASVCNTAYNLLNIYLLGKFIMAIHQISSYCRPEIPHKNCLRSFKT